MTSYPIILSFSQDVTGKNFRARVFGDGRVLVTLVDGEWWCFGIEPGGLASRGRSLAEAADNFRRDLAIVLGDYTELSANFTEYRQRLARFMKTNTGQVGEWDDALNALRAGQVTPSGAAAALPRKLASTVQAIRVEKIADLQAEHGTFQLAEAKAA